MWSTSAYALRLADRYLEVEEKIDIIINAFSLYNKLVPDRTPESLGLDQQLMNLIMFVDLDASFLIFNMNSIFRCPEVYGKYNFKDLTIFYNYAKNVLLLMSQS